MVDLAGIEGVVSSFMMKLQLASSGNQFSKIGHKTFSALACFMLMIVSNIKTVLSVSVRVAAFSACQALLT